MNWQGLASTRFSSPDGLSVDGALLHRTVDFDGTPLAVVGTLDQALVQQQARCMLDVVAPLPGRRCCCCSRHAGPAAASAG